LADPQAMAANAVIVPDLPGPEVPIALLVDQSSGQILYAREADRRFVPASITKVMTLYTAFELIDAGKLTPDQNFTMSENTFREWSRKGSTMFLNDTTPVSVDELLKGISTVSANDGCIVLAEGAMGSVEKWVALMNENARNLGMHDSHFGTPNGWMDDGHTYVSARDLIRLADALLEHHPVLFHRYIGHKNMLFNGIFQDNHDPMVGVVDGADGIKTGYTRQAGYGYLGTASRNGRRLLMVVAGVDRPVERARASRDLMEWGFAAFDSRKLLARGDRIGKAKVQGGANRSVGLVASRPVFATAPQGTSGNARLTVHYRGPVNAPIAKGQEIARLEVRIAGQKPYFVPLAAARDVPAANVWQRLLNGLLDFWA
jgi:D-alanyl-D-alanine carboxypeptidase (penicillin-binding protein 5/6)